MHFAPTTPQASVVTAGPVSMETDATVYPTVRAAPLAHRAGSGSVLFSLNAVCRPVRCPAEHQWEGQRNGRRGHDRGPAEIDLHTYIVVGDGRAYTAISEVRVLKNTFLPSPAFHVL